MVKEVKKMVKNLKCWKKIVNRKEEIVYKNKSNTKLNQNIEIFKQDYIYKKDKDRKNIQMA